MPSSQLTRAESYSLLNLAQGATKDQLKAAYRALALEFHPDKAGPDKGKQARHTEKFIQIREAFEVLNGELDAAPEPRDTGHTHQTPSSESDPEPGGTRSTQQTPSCESPHCCCVDCLLSTYSGVIETFSGWHSTLSMNYPNLAWCVWTDLQHHFFYKGIPFVAIVEHRHTWAEAFLQLKAVIDRQAFILQTFHQRRIWDQRYLLPFLAQLEASNYRWQHHSQILHDLLECLRASLEAATLRNQDEQEMTVDWEVWDEVEMLTQRCKRLANVTATIASGEEAGMPKRQIIQGALGVP
ncbi:hypothetical protein G7054_g8039 [Neopestalotiopsis clavispora]|nr:hypothetical protein G7054_g8039 [Neopestalotiopsis clavispora]